MPTVCEEILGLKYHFATMTVRNWGLRFFSHIHMPRGYVMVKLSMAKLGVYVWHWYAVHIQEQNIWGIHHIWMLRRYSVYRADTWSFQLSLRSFWPFFMASKYRNQQFAWRMWLNGAHWEAGLRAWDTQLVSDGSPPASSPGEHGFAALYLKSHSNRLFKTIKLPIAVYRISTTA